MRRWRGRVGWVQLDLRSVHRPRVDWYVTDDDTLVAYLTWGERYSDPVWDVGLMLPGLPKWVLRFVPLTGRHSL